MLRAQLDLLPPAERDALVERVPKELDETIEVNGEPP